MPATNLFSHVSDINVFYFVYIMFILAVNTYSNITGGDFHIKEIKMNKSDDRKLYYNNIINKFLEGNDNDYYTFDSNLNSYERKLIHEIAEKLNLYHESVGDGDVLEVSEREFLPIEQLPEMKIEIGRE